MWSIVGALALGIILGRINILPDQIFNWTGKISLVGLMVLLFIMGLGIGSNSEILGHLDNLGFKAFLLALGSVLGSIVVTFFMQKSIFKGGEK